MCLLDEPDAPAQIAQIARLGEVLLVGAARETAHPGHEPMQPMQQRGRECLIARAAGFENDRVDLLWGGISTERQRHDGFKMQLSMAELYDASPHPSREQTH